MANMNGRRDFLKGGLLLIGSGLVAVLAYLFQRSPIKNAPTPSVNTEVSTALAVNEKTKTEVASNTSTAKPPANNKPTETLLPQPQPSSTSKPFLSNVPGLLGARYPGRVIQVHHNDVHHWNYSDLEYWNYVDQDVVDNMVDQGVMSLTNETTVTAAWKSLIPDYQAGQIVAIKVSFNNSYDDLGSVEKIDSIIEPINAIIRGLNAIEVPNTSIHIYDSSRWIPKRFSDGCLYPGVLFKFSDHDPWGEGASEVIFNPPGRSPFSQWLSKEVTQANYLINVPIIKLHGMSKLSLAMKNHYGSINKPKDIHPWTATGSEEFTTSYNPMVDLNGNTHIRDKTVLTVGDGIYAALNNYDRSFPRRWVTFGNQTPKSLFFSTDPVAIDCVMGDILNEEKVVSGKGEVKPNGFAYLLLAEEAGLGVYERGDPWLNTYSKLDFKKIEIS